MEEKKSSICKIGEELDFVKTIQNIVSTGKLDFLKTQITKLDERIEAKIPNWKINNLLFLQNIEHLEIENVKRNFEFLFALSEHSTTIYDVLKIVKILGEMNDEQQIWRRFASNN
uniref:Uncharacterized protein n=1 Tax=Globodera pallida TaxID=36090 RepID=A0A183CK21_GLOPA